jgi:hypothetical protein
MHDALYTLIEDVQKYQKLAYRADEALSRPAASTQQPEVPASYTPRRRLGGHG